MSAGTYRWVFVTGDFYARQGVACFHPEVPVVFAAEDLAQKYHVPLLLSPFSCTPYQEG
ncbi:hydroxyisourate hydrolase [Streptomyces virginiae]|uniref:hydroxyisourate hydrolase n=1 Tax=Streptomyces virginiae TaxID=1961 RepID=UPI00380C1A35